MDFRTSIPLETQHNSINYSSTIVFLGSCFSENIFSKMAHYKFTAFSNPFGVLFHPIAIESLIIQAVKNKKITAADIFYFNECWHYFNASYSMSTISKPKLLFNLNEAIKTTNTFLHKATHIVITLGTSWVYRFIEENKIVANCHKIPQKKFLKELLTITQIVSSIKKSITLLKSINPTINILLTVSPVRHLKDGFVENSLSKAHLLTAIHEVIKDEKDTYYFPSFEIMNDDLRGYRFYEQDMVHPNKIAIDYIWELFKKKWICTTAYQTMKQVNEVQKALQHKPFNGNSTKHKQFLKKINNQIQVLKANGINF